MKIGDHRQQRNHPDQTGHRVAGCQAIIHLDTDPNTPRSLYSYQHLSNAEIFTPPVQAPWTTTVPISTAHNFSVIASRFCRVIGVPNEEERLKKIQL